MSKQIRQLCHALHWRVRKKGKELVQMEVTHGTTLLSKRAWEENSSSPQQYVPNKQEDRISSHQDITHQLKVTKESSYRALQEILAVKPGDDHTKGYQHHKNNRCPKADVLFSHIK